MAEKKTGTPLAAAHLRPESRQQASAINEWPQPGEVRTIEESDGQIDAIVAGLMKLREQFADDQIERLPKPMWRGAWDDLKGSNCSICNGYHVAQHCIHLDYVGHANATNRLLDADLTWNWEPMAYTDQGLPLFSDKGMWIKLTVCGVTRIGFGDGSSIKEIIGDAIRNAAMRFGVALDLWAKINLHEERNVGDGQTRSRPGPQGSGLSGQGRPGVGARGEQSTGRGQDDAVAPDAPRAANQDALDSLAAVCDQNGYDQRTMGALYEKFAKRVGKGNLRLIDAPPVSIVEFTTDLILRSNAEPDVPGDSGGPPVPGRPEGESGDVPGLSAETEVGGEGDGSGDADAEPGATDGSDTFDTAPAPASDDPAESMF